MPQTAPFCLALGAPMVPLCETLANRGFRLAKRSTSGSYEPVPDSKRILILVAPSTDTTQLDELADEFDWALNEECVQYDECAGLGATFIDAGKAVFHVEYVDDTADGQGLADQLCGGPPQQHRRRPELVPLVRWEPGAR